MRRSIIKPVAWLLGAFAGGGAVVWLRRAELFTEENQTLWTYRFVIIAMGVLLVLSSRRKVER